MIGDAAYVVKDEVAMRAVDGFTGLEEGGWKRQLDKQPEKPMSDGPSSEKSRRALRSVATVGGGQHQCTILQYTWPVQEVPGWFVDLQEPQEVQGVLLYTGAHGKCRL